MATRFKALVSAYACNPFKGSEEGVGWGWVKALSEYHDLWVITAAFHRRDIERAVAERPELFSSIRFYYVPHKHWHYAPTKGWLLIERSALKPIMHHAYLAWQREAYRLAVMLHQEIHFDLVHQLTYVGFRFPGHLWRLKIPFVWGPIGGLENTPWHLLPVLGFNGCIYYAGRNAINYLHKRLLRGPKQAFRKARGGIIASTNGIRREIRRWYGVDSAVICEIGPPGEVPTALSLRRAGEPLKLAWSGLHLPGKGLPLLLRALSKIATDRRWDLDILGQGPSTEKWKKLARKLGINEGCRWHGRLARSKGIALVGQAHVFVITSLKDLTSTVLLEALSQGVPVVCPDHCGFSDVVTSSCGIKVPVASKQLLVSGLSEAISYLETHEVERRRLAKGSMERVKAYSWEKKAKEVDLIYRKAVSHGTH